MVIRILAALVGVVLLLSVPADMVQAQRPANGRIILTNGTLIMYPGAQASECYDLGAGYIRLEADSPPGRTGEAAILEVARTTDSGRVVLLSTVVSQGQDDPVYNVGDRVAIEARYGVAAGRYCYTVTVTKTNEDTGDPNRPDRPNKQVFLSISHRP